MSEPVEMDDAQDESLGLSPIGCLFTAIGGVLAGLLCLVGTLGGRGTVGVFVAFGVLLIAAPLSIIVGGKLERPGQVSAAYLGLVLVT